MKKDLSYLLLPIESEISVKLIDESIHASIHEEFFSILESTHYDVLLSASNNVIGFKIACSNRWKLDVSNSSKVEIHDTYLVIKLVDNEVHRIDLYQGFCDLVVLNPSGELGVVIWSLNLWKPYQIIF
jgi:hypothetical protein